VNLEGRLERPPFHLLAETTKKRRASRREQAANPNPQRQVLLSYDIGGVASGSTPKRGNSKVINAVGVPQCRGDCAARPAVRKGTAYTAKATGSNASGQGATTWSFTTK